MDKILLVGNSGLLKEKNIVDVIDSFDIVCRFNWGGSKISMDKYKKYIGTKKNIWFNLNIVNLIEDRKITTNKEKIKYLNSYDKIYIAGIDWVMFPELKSTHYSIENFLDLTSEQIDMIRASDLINLSEIFDTDINNVWIFPNNYCELIRLEIPLLSNNIPTTGLKSIHFLLKQYKKIYLCGFDGFKGFHFYDEEISNMMEKDKKMWNENEGGHSGKREMEYIRQLEKENKIEFIT